MRFFYKTFTDAGPRKVNQDAVGTKSFGAFNMAVAVADGLGGHIGGEVASDLAVKMFLELSVGPSVDLEDVAKEIHQKIQDEQLKTLNLRSMATTLSAAIFRPGHMEFVHCGDSRIAMARNNGIRRITTDHSEAERLFAAGALSKEQRLNYPRKNILESALGISGSQPTIDTGSIPLSVGDKFFFSTDGFHNRVLLRDLFESARKASNIDSLNERLMDEISSKNPDDNYTLATVFVST